MRSSAFPDALAILRQRFGHQDFRPLQSSIVQSVLAGRDTLAILPTGGGKSICFQVPALALGGATLVISPLISLMQDQTAALQARGIPAAMLSSVQPAHERRGILSDLLAGRLRLVYLSPERLVWLAPRLRDGGFRPTLLAVDEAHCISEWGHDFRPEYRRIRAARVRLGRPPVLALTGSATPAVRDDIVASLGLAVPDRHVGSFDRPNLAFHVRRVRDDRARAEALDTALASAGGTAIVYAPTRRLVEALVWRLRCRGYRTEPYHAGLGPPLRSRVLQSFLAGGCDVVVATSAFGMGIDKPDVRLVVHWSMPPSLESYYQEAGRAGRDGAPSLCVLLHHRRDGDLHRRQQGVTWPDRVVLTRIWDGRTPPAAVPAGVLASAERLRREVPDPGNAGAWQRVERRRKAALTRLRAMERYAGTTRCRRRCLLRWFGEGARACTGCDRCDRPRLWRPRRLRID